MQEELVVDKPKISRTFSLTATGDNTLIDALPDRYKANLVRLAILNRAGADCILHFKETFTPDASAGNPSPTSQPEERYPCKVAAGDSVDLNGSPLCTFLSSVTVNIDAQPMDVSLVLELE